MRIAIAAAFVLMFLISYSSPLAAAATTTWTTTADFDGGTKSQPSPADGNYQVETNTDNLGIAAGALELASLKGDSFTLADTDADTFKWNLQAKGSPTINQREIANGVLSVDISGVAGQPFGGVISSASISGDFDIRLQADEQANSAGTNRYLYFQMFNILGAVECADDVTQDGMLYFVNFAAVGVPMGAYKCVNGVFTQIGTNTDRPADPIWLRMQRTGTTLTWYYSTDGSTWTTDETNTDAAVGGAVWIEPLCSQDSTGRCDLDFDLMNVAAGTVDAGGFRTTGSWASPDVAVTARTDVTDITLTTSGLSASFYVDIVEILVAGSAVYTDDTDVTSGTSRSVDPNTIVSADFSVRVTLAGTNAGTPVLEAVDVTYGPAEESEFVFHVRAAFRCTYSPFSGLHCEDRSLTVDPNVPIMSRAWHVDGRFIGRGRTIAVAPQDLAVPWDLGFWSSDAAHIRLTVRTASGASSTCDTATMDRGGTPCGVVDAIDNVARTVAIAAAVALLAVAVPRWRPARDRNAEVEPRPE